MEKYIDSAQKGSQAKMIFEQGYNCAQSVVMAYDDVLGHDKELLATIASSFGGGFARCREVCGAVSGMGMIAGFITPAIDPKDRVAKMDNYSLVQGAVEKFRESNGSIICRELLAQRATDKGATGSNRSCADMVEMAATLIGEAINEKSK